MRWISYQIICDEEEGILLRKRLAYNEDNLAIAEAEAYQGKYSIVEDGSNESSKNPLPIEFGGTGTTTASLARKAMNYIMQDPLTNCSVSDSVENWTALGAGYAYISKYADGSKIRNFPSAYDGYLENITANGSTVYQKFCALNSTGETWHRAGSKTEGWYNGGKWVKETNDTPVSIRDSNVFPVGSVYTTRENINPAKYLGGEWTLFDKDFKPYAAEIKDAFTSNYGHEGSIAMVRSGKTIRARLKLTLARDVAPENEGAYLGSIDLKKLGLTNVSYYFYGIPVWSDTRDSILMFEATATSERIDYLRIRMTDVITRGHDTEILFLSGDTFYIEIPIVVHQGNMIDADCGCFYWRRTA